MNRSDEGVVLTWFERALDQPAAHRLAWLEAQSLPPWLHDRVRRLLATEARLGEDFLERPPPLPDSPVLPHVGDRVGSYELVRQIDAGGMGIVYLARRADRAYEQQVAVKLIRPLHLHASAGYREQLIARFENERRLLARLNHRNVARILDGGATTSGVPYLVMEYVEGRSLLDYCDEHALDVMGRLRLFRKVCDGVQEAHRHLIVHRDLKPENILVADGEPRLLDFGIARAIEADPPEDPRSVTSLTAMTPAYASPEQVRHEALTTSSDVYSLGVVLYQLLAGVRPYDLTRATPAQAERLVCEVDPAPLRTALDRATLGERERQQRRTQLTGELDRIVAKAMHKEAKHRYASAQELGDDVDRYLRNEPVLAHPESALYRIRKFIRRYRALTAVASVALVAVLVATGAAFWQAAVARRAAADTQLMNEFLLEVLSMSDPFDAGSELTLSAALDEAAKLVDQRFADRPDLTAQIRFGIGYSMLSRYRVGEAAEQLERALAESTTQFGPDDIRTLRVLEGIAGLRYEQGRLDEALRTYEQAISAVERTGKRGDPLYVELLGNLGNVHLMQENYPEADRWLRRAVEAFTAQGDALTLDRANLYNNLAHAAHGLEDLPRAAQLYEQAQRDYEQLFPNGNPDLASLLNNRALLAEDQGEPAAALVLHQQSLAVRRKVFGAEHPMIVVALSNVARLTVSQGDPAAALAAAEEAAGMADRVYRTPHGRHASAYAALAEARAASGDIDGAIEAWRRGQSIIVGVSDAPPAPGRYLERVRTVLCKHERARAALCAG